ncbi:DUF2975 domain-containing protein [Ciceribacter sp. L1K22]|uniref:DUF2975 domain-containing protein n=1 Tax=Ciceribacter sp. L1K22 TaxID=2820275 RepID=UPI001ABED5AE|nr:DUF2975 domain-containing protein [Ciceribacter sp. L1K22]MBO3758863.1 DUF2975 domain-containing protein [Ciceribacter sp. L1K22]
MTGDAFQKIRRLSEVLKLLVMAIALTGGATLAYCAWRLSFDLQNFTTDIGRYLSGASLPMTFTPVAIGVLILIACINTVIASGGLLAVWSLFDRYAHGEVFSARCGVLLRRAGIFAFAGALSSVVSRTAAILAVTYANPPGQKMLTLAFGTTELFLLLLAGMLVLLGHIMAVGADLEADYRSFV